MRPPRHLLAAVGLTASVAGCASSDPPPPPEASPCQAAPSLAGPWSTRCGHVVDATGRVTIFRGVNARVAGLFDADLGPGKVPLMEVPTLPDEDLVRMRRIGFDLVRLPLSWSAVEPEDSDPPRYDAAYLDRIAAFVAAAKRADVRVLLDFHQDAYSKWIGQDGAPLWAIQPPPDKLLEGPLTDLSARTTSVQVQRAFSTFFDPANATGQRLRARFSAMAAAVAAKVAGDATVVGIDLYNEPVASEAQLRPFYEQVGAAIRKVDPTRVIYIEPPGIRNLFDKVSPPSSPLSLPGVVYAPHVYTKVFTTGCDLACRNDFTIDTLRPSNESARAEADGWAAPLLVGEYGYDPKARFTDYVGMQLALQDEFQASSTFWVWKESSEGAWGFFDRTATGWTERAALRKPFARVLPRAFGAFPKRFSWDEAARRFSAVLVGDPRITGPSVVHVPLPEDLPGAVRARCDDRALPVTVDAHGDVSLDCTGPGVHTLVVEIVP